MSGDYIPPYRRLYLTPDSIPVGRFCRSISIPDDPQWVGLVDGVLSELMDAGKWRQHGTLTPEETADAWSAMMLEAWNNPSCGSSSAPTPYWDNSTDVDDQEPPDLQPWYGVSGGGGFVEDFGVWVVSGFLAETVSPLAAVLYRTYERRFRLAFLAGGPAGLVKVIIDNGAEIIHDLSGETEEVREFDFIGDPDVELHEILIVNEGAP